MVAWERTAESTVVVVCDGIGSGIRANLAATFCSSRLLENLRNGVSMRQAFLTMAELMGQVKADTDRFYAATSVARVLNDGSVTVLSYESPSPIFISKYNASELKVRNITVGTEMISESHCHLEKGEGLLLMSDGITQAGMGNGYTFGWESAGVCGYLNSCISEGADIKALPALVHCQARRLWKDSRGDDCTVSMVSCWKGISVNIFTGPPSEKGKDYARVQDFLLSDGFKVVCGATTAKIIARETGREMHIEESLKGQHGCAAGVLDRGD